MNYVAKALLDYCGEAMSPTQVYNHSRKLRQKWARVVKLKDLSGALFDHDVNAIMLEPEHYMGHCKVETKSISLSLIFSYCRHLFSSSLFIYFSTHDCRTILRMLNSSTPQLGSTLG